MKVFALTFALGARHYKGKHNLTEESIQHYVNMRISPEYRKKKTLSSEQETRYKALKDGFDQVRKTTSAHMNESVKTACALDYYLEAKGMI